MSDKKNRRESARSSLSVIARIVRDTRPILPWLTVSMLVSIMSICLSMLAPEFIGSLTDAIYAFVEEGSPIDRGAFIRGALLLGAVYIMSGLLSVVTMVIMNNVVTRHFTCGIRTAMSEKISKIPISRLDSTSNGEIISRMTNDVSIMGGSVHDIFDIIISGALKLIIILTVIFLQNPIMALAVVVFVPLSILLSARLAARSEKYFDESRAAAGRIYSAAEENLTGFDTVKAFNLEAKRQEAFDRLAEDFRGKSYKGFATSGIVQPIVTFVNSIAYIAICIIGALLALRGSIGVGDLMAFILYTQLFSGPLEAISNGFSMMQSTIASAKRVYEFLDGEEMTEPKEREPEFLPKGDVRLDGVSFSYTPDKPLIKDLSLNIRAGQKIAIVGPTGGGKTTIVNLLMRFYDPDSGSIIIDGTDTLKRSRPCVRSAFSMVLQESILFSGTVYDNIAYGNERATREDVTRAAENAHIDKWIEGLPLGYDTVINEESTNISGGQKQLLTIARAYLSNRPILILDEATSNVDTRTELIIQRTMDELMKGRTAFVIAHRLSTIENADLILVVNKGDIVEKGTHRELLEMGGLYSELYRSQYSLIGAEKAKE